MTTAHHTSSKSLVRTTAATVAAGAVVVAVGALLAGSPAAYGAMVGAAIAVGIFGFGAFTVDVVARVMPAASLLVAMVTYTFQVVLLAFVFVAISRSGLLDHELDRAWLGGAIIVGSFVWLTVLLWQATTARIPAFDAGETSPVNTRLAPVKGGAR